MSNKKIKTRIEFLACILTAIVFMGVIAWWWLSIEAGKVARGLSFIEYGIRMQCCLVSMIGCLSFIGISTLWWADRELLMRRTSREASYQENLIQFDFSNHKNDVVIATY